MTQRESLWHRLHALSERILGSHSVTGELERWCSEHGIGDGEIVALPVTGAPAPLDDNGLTALYPFRPAEIRFRRVRLTSGGVGLVDALNWYFPEHLPADICEQFHATTIPFGRAIRSLNPRRRTILVRRCPPREVAAGDPNAIAFEHHAVVWSDAGLPLAVVHERFRAMLAMSVPLIPKFA